MHKVKLGQQLSAASCGGCRSCFAGGWEKGIQHLHPESGKKGGTGYSTVKNSSHLDIMGERLDASA